MADALKRSLLKLQSAFRRRLDTIFSRGELHATDATGGVQKLQIELQPGEVLDNVEHLEPYGFTSRPLPGAEVASASMAGDRNRTVVLIAADRRYRKKNLAAGEVALYTDEGDYIKLSRGRIVEVVAGTRVRVTAPDVEIVASTKVTLTSPQVDISGALTVQGAILSNTSMADPSGTMAEMRSSYNTHTHPGGAQPSPLMT